MAVRLAVQTEPIPGYRLIERLGRGGFGEVWKAEASGGLMKAIKFVYGELDVVRGQGGVGAEQELRALNRVKTVRHPFILSLERVDIIEGQLVIVMELADRSLHDRFQECCNAGLTGIPREELLQYMEEAAEALDLMNGEYQLQHLDIKPQNLFLCRNHIKVADFGLVKDLEGMKASITGGVTPVYAAPETFEGWVTRYCDQYSLAIVYQELLTGRRPFDGTNAKHLLLQHVQEPPDLTGLSAEDKVVIGRGLAKKPGDRFPNCMAMIEALRGVETPAEEAAPPPIPRQTIVRPAPMMTPSGRPAPMMTPPIQTPAGAPRSPVLVPKPEAEQPNHRITVSPSPLNDRPPLTETPKPPLRPRTEHNLGFDSELLRPIEFTGQGVLFPALIVGLGRTGLTVLQSLRDVLAERFGTVDRLPHIRMLYIDSDPDTYATAVKAPGAAAMSGKEILLARLNRPSHFLKVREGQPNVADWLDPQQLFRMNRNQQTAGARCIGRLAFIDNFREISERLREELTACADPEKLACADQNTHLGLRVTRPRVYVVSNLAGGTGGGMFIDLGYLARSLARQAGHEGAEVVGLLALPRVGTDKPGRNAAVLGNAYASLTELNHFSDPGVTFKAAYQHKQPPLIDAEPPFARCLLYPAGADETSDRASAVVAAGFLFRDLLGPIGRAADESRTTVLNLEGAPRPTLLVSAVGLYRLSWPRRALVQQTARRLCHRVVQHWLRRETGPLTAEVQKWAKEQWERRMLTTDRLIGCLRAAAEGAVEEAPEDVFVAIAEKFVKGVPENTNPDPALVQKTLEEVEKLVGRPEGLALMARPPLLPETLEEAARNVLVTCEQKLSEMAVYLVEQPKFRFAGAEEAIRQFNALLTQAVQQQEPLCLEFLSKSNDAYIRIVTIAETLKQMQAAGARKPRTFFTHELGELLRLYPTIRLRGVVLGRLLVVLRSLLGNCPEFLREFTHCRNRLTELVKAFETPLGASQVAEPGPGRDLFPAGCRTINDALTQVMAKVTEDDLLELDQRIQTVLKKQFTALVHVCTTPNNLFRELGHAMQQEAEAYVASRLGAANAIETFLDQYRNSADAARQLTEALREAAPGAVPEAPKNRSFSLVAVPSDNLSDQFTALSRMALPDALLVAAPKAEDIVFYREACGLRLQDLPQCGPDVRDLYKQMVATPNAMPHSRTDITDWRLPGEEKSAAPEAPPS